MKYLLSTGVACCIALQGCTSFNFDYVPPQGVETAHLTIKSAWDSNNQRVIFHGQNPCNPEQAKLVGLINAGAIGQENVKQLEIRVPAGVEILLSLPQQDLTALGGGIATFRYCQPIAKFVPEAGRSYTLVFSSCKAKVYVKNAASDSDNGTLIQSELERSCSVTTENMGDAGKIFFLGEKTRSDGSGTTKPH